MSNRVARTRDNSLPSEAVPPIIARKATLGAFLAELVQANAGHFGAAPNTVIWSEAAWLSDAIAKRRTSQTSISATENTPPDACYSLPAPIRFCPAGLPAVEADDRRPEPEPITMTKLSDPQRVILSTAAQHKMGLAHAPNALPAAERNAVFRNLIKKNLLTDEGLGAIGIGSNETDGVAKKTPMAVPGAKPQPQNTPFAEAALAALLAQGVALLDLAFTTPVAMPRHSLRDAAMAVLAAWDEEANRAGDMVGALDTPMQPLRALLARKPTRMPRAAGTPREGTK